MYSVLDLYIYLCVCVCVYLSLNTGVIDVAAVYMSDMKEGYCDDRGYYNKEACCWFYNQVFPLSPHPPHPPPPLSLPLCKCLHYNPLCLCCIMENKYTACWTSLHSNSVLWLWDVFFLPIVAQYERNYFLLFILCFSECNQLSRRSL